MREEVAAFLREHEAAVRPLEKALNEAAWQLALTGEDRWKEEVVRLAIARRGLSADPVGYRRLHDWHGRRADLADPIQARQVRQLFLEFRASQMDPETLEALERLAAEAEQRFDTFRSTLAGQPATANALEEILRASDDGPARQRAWEASQQIGPEVAPLVQEMVRHRNRVARGMGFPDHFAFALETRELAESPLFVLLEEVDRRTAGPFLVEKARLDAELCARFGVIAGDLRPWHYADPFFQHPPPRRDLALDALFAGADLPALMVASFDGIGLEVRDILARSDLFEKPGKSQHGFCADIDREGDIRILCNLVGNEHWMRTLLHEGGHAVYDKYVDRSLPYFLRRPAHACTTEAVAMLLERQIYQAPWLTAVAGLPAGEAAALAAAAAAHHRFGLLLFARWALVMIHFERALYRTPEADLDRLWWTLKARFQGLTPPVARRGPDWAAKLHLALAPVYYQNYLLGELFASQLHRAIQGWVPGGRLALNPAAGAFLRERVFAPANRWPWPRLVAEATEGPLSPEAFAAEAGAEGR
ncbi:MAG TPA: M2 family metallopeptidase [Candidatus Methylomirabilis sp.]|nr:M2 family metallopeptidase [Candidatus Methylomirabilis sp.]